jgi:hypothetical protein
MVQEVVAFNMILAQNDIHAHACTQIRAQRVTKCSSTAFPNLFQSKDQLKSLQNSADHQKLCHDF